MSIGNNWSPFYTPYRESEVKRLAPNKGGVYALWVNYKNGRWECFYIGKSEDLQKRLLDHLSDQEGNECIKGNVKYKCGFSWLEISTEQERSGAEKFLYDKLKPACNQNDPGGKLTAIPLPPTPSPTAPTA